MLVSPDLVPFDQWIENFTDEELCELLDVDMEELECLHDEVASDTCPSCNGEGTVEFDHTFKELVTGKRITANYEFDCSYCEGDGTIEKPLTEYEAKIKEAYDCCVKQDLARYLLVLDAGHI